MRGGHSCFLYLGSIVVDEYGPDPGSRELLATMLASYCELTLPKLAEGLDQQPDTVDDLFRLIYRWVYSSCDVW